MSYLYKVFHSPVMIEEIKRRILDGGSITIDEAVELAENCDIDELCDTADEIRRQFCGDRMDTCSIVNARSGLCGEDCKWCSQSVKAKSDVKKYEIIDTETLLNLAKRNDGYGVDRFSMVTSGRKVSAKTDMKLCASMGLVDKPTLEMLKTAGVTRYHCNMETVSAYFPSLCSTHTPADKWETIRNAKSVGLEVCSGGIIGMGETMRQRVEFAFELKEQRHSVGKYASARRGRNHTHGRNIPAHTSKSCYPLCRRTRPHFTRCRKADDARRSERHDDRRPADHDRQQRGRRFPTVRRMRIHD